MALTTALSMLHYVAHNEDRNLVDRMHCYFTTNLLIGLAVLVSFKQFGGKPLECLVPDLFSGAWEQYAEQYCFAQDTYYIPMSSTIADKNTEARRERRISYYQWVPFFLLISAAFFRLPSLLWKHFSDYSGIRIHQIIKLASDSNNIKPDIKNANIQSLCLHLQGALRFHRRLHRRQITPHRILRMFNIQYSAYYVSVLYLITKSCYLLNVTVQLFMLNRFLGTTKHAFYGLGAIFDLLNGTTWEQSGMFPRVSLCDFTVRVMGNIQDYTIQCVLVINIFNEKIFIFLWFWYSLLFVFTLGSLAYWTVVVFCQCYNINYIAKHLEMGEEFLNVEDYEHRKKIALFVRTYLRADGMFAIRMLSTYSGVIFGTDLVRALWKSYTNIEEKRKCKSETDLTKVGVDDLKRHDYLGLRKFSNTKSLDEEEKKNLITPPHPPPPELVKMLLKGRDSIQSNISKTSDHPDANISPPYSHEKPVFRLANNEDRKGSRPNAPFSPNRSPSPPPPQLNQRRVGNN